MIWNHPIDVHFTTATVDSWPQLYLEVWSQDSYGRNDIVGYASCHVPSMPGTHRLECLSWRPYGTFMDRLRGMFLGGFPQLVSPQESVLKGDRLALKTETMGTIMVSISVVTTDGSEHGVKLSPS